MELDLTWKGLNDISQPLVIINYFQPLKGYTHRMEKSPYVGDLAGDLSNFYASVLENGVSEVIIENAGLLFSKNFESRMAFLKFKNFLEDSFFEEKPVIHILESGSDGKINLEELTMRYSVMIFDRMFSNGKLFECYNK